LPHEVVETADEANGDANECAPGTRAEPSVDPVPDESETRGRSRQFQADTGVTDPTGEATIVSH
jgi:hypothetical protein